MNNVSLVAPKVSRVMIVDDHELLRDGLQQLISRQKDLVVCGKAASEREARQHFDELSPDIAIVDLTLGEDSGLDLIRWIIAKRPDTKVVVSTMHDERDYGERAMEAGASAYVNKHLPANTILTAIARVIDGGLFFSEELSNRLMQRAVGRDSTKVPVQSLVTGLSNRELQIFTLIGQGQTTRQIADCLHISTNTVGTHRERLKIKLDLASSAELVRKATLWVTQTQ